LKRLSVKSRMKSENQVPNQRYLKFSHGLTRINTDRDELRKSERLFSEF
jgi:hypothetical protein